MLLFAIAYKNKAKRLKIRPFQAADILPLLIRTREKIVCYCLLPNPKKAVFERFGQSENWLFKFLQQVRMKVKKIAKSVCYRVCYCFCVFPWLCKTASKIKKKPQYLVVFSVELIAGFVRSGKSRDGAAIVRHRRNRVTLFRQSRYRDK